MFRIQKTIGRVNNSSSSIKRNLKTNLQSEEFEIILVQFDGEFYFPYISINASYTFTFILKGVPETENSFKSATFTFSFFKRTGVESFFVTFNFRLSFSYFRPP